MSPTSANFQRYGGYLGNTGRLPEAIEQLKRALDLDPLWLKAHQDLGLWYWWDNRHEEAVRQLHKALDLDPHYAAARWTLGGTYLEQRLYNEAIAEFQAARESAAGDPLYLTGLAYANAIVGKKHKALSLLREMEDLSRRQYVSPVFFAWVHIALEQNDQAMECLEKAYEERAPLLPCACSFPWFDPLRSDPRFRDLLKRMKLPLKP